MKTLAILLSMLALTCHAQTTPTIKGHTLGESVLQFVDNSNATTKHLVQWCGADQTGSPMCMNITSILAKPDAAPAALAVHCDETGVDKMEDFPGSSTSIQKEMYVSYWCTDFNGDATFEGGKLVSIRTEIWSPWSEAYSALLKKFGKPVAVQDQILQNGFGAKFRSTKGLWVAKSYRVTAQELFSEEGLNRYVSLEMTTPGYAQEKAQGLKKSQTNALD